MSEAAFTALQGKRIVLLQGPVGPFFSRLRKDLERVSATVCVGMAVGGNSPVRGTAKMAANLPRHRGFDAW